ncbi:MAG: VOC family protein [Frankiaceae bacterium]|nr:VOC family protein [Frankiaceae bacterium]MBV9870607.1 VOC family protein [Frankiaceae bacterium]
MSDNLTVGAITLFVSDIAVATEFYLRVFDTEAIFQDEASTALRFTNIVINLLVDSEAPELVEPANVAPAGSGTRSQLTITVDSCDATVAELTGRGAALLNGPIDRPWGQRTAAFADPDGHVWEVASDVI